MILWTASGGIEFEVYRLVSGSCTDCFDDSFWCFNGSWYYGYGDTTTIEDFATPLETLGAGRRQLLMASFQAASLVETLPMIGFVAQALDIGLVRFTLRADDDQPPGPPLTEPAGVALVAAALMALGLVRLRRSRA